jgi:branched-chain amino acid transport system ATP-binding protein
MNGVLFLVALGALVVWVLGVLETVSIPAEAYRRAGRRKGVWVTVAALLGPIGAVIWWVVGAPVRRQLFAVAEDELVEPEASVDGSGPASSGSEARWTVGVAAVPGAAKPDPILVVDGMHRRFGGLVAVDVDHVEVQRGSITALIGPNGAGKTTFFNLVTGFDRPDAGTWTFDGTELTGMSGHRVARAGMVRTFQLTKALGRMTVMENMLVAARHQLGERAVAGVLPWLWRRQEAAAEERAVQWLDHFGMLAKRDDYAGTMSGGQRKLLEMARALMVAPSMLMLDEPMAGVNPALTQSLLDRIVELRAQGMTILFVEHDMDVVMGISDWVICMGEGRVIAEGPPDAVAADPVVIDAYLGTHFADRGGQP